MSDRAAVDALDTRLLAQGASVFTALSGTANVIMQLSRPEIGYAVKDSVVTEGNLFTSPRRRQRTTVAFLAVAVLGTAEERAAFRRATNRSHAQVRSAPGAEPAYRAFDPELQRWVAACIYRGFEESRERVHGPLRGAEREQFYRQGVIFGAMLQMPPELWPPDRDAFEEYWADGLEHVRIDEPIREYLLRIVRLEYLGRPVPAPVVRARLWLTTGYLPPELRAAMGLGWTAPQQQWFERFNQVVGAVVQRLPANRRAWPFTRSLADVRARLAEGRDLLAT
ncbi:MAG TPA: oxygenase MpaB family protein [Marmoricola sp.]|nr:oxygenase MpaB family protein [Marmoricola sp.]